MDKYRLVSNYNVKQYKVHKSNFNNNEVENIVNREFYNRNDLEVVVSDLTYINVAGKLHYICLLINLFNREIIGDSAGSNKDAALVYEAFLRSKINLTKIKVFHTDRGNGFKNRTIEEVLKSFEIERSLSKKGYAYDNAAAEAEATYKIIKAEFAFNRVFRSLGKLKRELRSYILWYNNKRIHSSLNYMTPIEYRLEKVT